MGYIKRRSIARQILCHLESHHDKSIQQTITDVFRCCSESFQLNTDIKKVIKAVSANGFVLLDGTTNVVELLIDYTGTEPEPVSEVC